MLGYITLCTLITFSFFFFSNFQIIFFLVGNKMPCDKLFLLEVVGFSLHHQKCTLHMGRSLSTCLRSIKDCFSIQTKCYNVIKFVKPQNGSIKELLLNAP
jgi:hypothetical protein